MFIAIKIIYDVAEQRAIFNSLEEAIENITTNEKELISWNDYGSPWIKKGYTSDSNIYYLIRKIEIGKWLFSS